MALNIPAAGSTIPQQGSSEFPVGVPSVTAQSPVNPVQLQQPQAPSGGGGSGGKSDSGGGIGSAIGGILGKVGGAILGGLFAKGGPVGYADGGEAQSIDPHTLGVGYLVGALHQQMGGSPKTLEMAVKAAQDILNGQPQSQQGFAVGGEVNNPNNQGAVQSAIMKAMMGEGADTTKQANVQAAPQANPTSAPQLSAASNSFGGSPVSVLPPQTMLGMQEGANSGNYQDQSILNYLSKSAQPTQQVTPAPKMAKKGGYMNNFNDQYNEGPVALPQFGYAQGGPPDQQQQPLGPGQVFAGDGSVKGPGTATSDSIPARLSNGEFVMSAPATKFWGVSKLSQMNEKGKQGFMEQLGQVQANQQQGAAQAPQGAPQPPVPGQAGPSATPQAQQSVPPADNAGQVGGAMKNGGLATRNLNRGFCGL